MLSLRELQMTFAQALREPGHIPLHGLIVADRMPAELHAECYRNNVRSNYRATLRAVYPVVAQLVGPLCFDAAADAYARAYPSDSGDLNRFGRHFPEFLESFEPVRALEYLPDVAALEWRIETCFYGREAPGIAMQVLSGVSQTDFAALRFRLHPAARLLASRFPVLHIWQAHQPGADEDETVSLAEGGAFVLVRRDGFAAVPEALDHGSFWMLNLLAAGRTVGEAFDSALDEDPAFDVAAFLARHLANGVLAEVTLPAPAAAARSEKTMNPA